MGRWFLARLAAIAAFLVTTAVLAAVVWWLAFTAALDQLETRGRTDLAFSADRLSGHLLRYRELAVLLAEHPALLALIERPQSDATAANRLLQEMADKTGSEQMRLIDHSGEILASVGVESETNGFFPAYIRAMNGALGTANYIDDFGRRLYTFAAPIFAPEGPSLGALSTTVDLRQIEWNWPSDPSPVFFSDRAGRVFVSNRSDLILATRDGLQEAGTFPRYQRRNISGHELWVIDGWRYLPRRSLHLTQDLPVIGMVGEILLDISPVRRIAFLQAAATIALCLAFGTFLFLAAERRRALAEKLNVEAAANAALEARVKSRTLKLSQANASLLSEVHERQETEAALRQAQSDLVQAGKLSALGQMSAGISHELNQPLMAIRSFAENAEMFLARGDAQEAGNNLTRISELARRMGRIIKNLRAFARHEKESLTDVDLVAVVDAVLELAHSRLAEMEVAVNWRRPAHPVLVRGGEVRLQQVVMNLVSNAVDAMSDSQPRELDITIDPTGPGVRLAVRDSGPGITDPNKMFDPFYSTKEVGQSEGMGLGLSISYGLVQSFGGTIRGQNHSDGGAVMTVELAHANAAEAA